MEEKLVRKCSMLVIKVVYNRFSMRMKLISCGFLLYCISFCTGMGFVTLNKLWRVSEYAFLFGNNVLKLFTNVRPSTNYRIPSGKMLTKLCILPARKVFIIAKLLEKSTHCANELQADFPCKMGIIHWPEENDDALPMKRFYMTKVKKKVTRIWWFAFAKRAKECAQRVWLGAILRK